MGIGGWILDIHPSDGRVTDVLWIGWSGWVCWCRRLADIALLSFLHEGLDAGFNCVLHLLHHLFRIEGWIRSSLSGLRWPLVLVDLALGARMVVDSVEWMWLEPVVEVGGRG